MGVFCFWNPRLQNPNLAPSSVLSVFFLASMPCHSYFFIRVLLIYYFLCCSPFRLSVSCQHQPPVLCSQNVVCSLFSSFCFYHHLPFLPSLSFFSSSLCCHYPVPLTCSLIIKNLVSCPLFLFYSLVYIYNMLSIFPSILFSSFSPLPSRSLPSFHYLRSCWSTLASSLLFCSCLGLFCFLFCD